MKAKGQVDVAAGSLRENDPFSGQAATTRPILKRLYQNPECHFCLERRREFLSRVFLEENIKDFI